MEELKLYNSAEQKCKRFGCAFNKCNVVSENPEKCRKLFRNLQECIAKEKKYLIDKYKTKNN